MPPSRQTLYLRRGDVARLQELAPVGLHVAYEDAHGFVVSQDGTPLHKGRYQVVYAFLSGWAAGAAARADHATTAEAVAEQLRVLHQALAKANAVLAFSAALIPPTDPPTS